MFSMGILATGFLWVYWTIQLTPFMPLQEVLESEFRIFSIGVVDIQIDLLHVWVISLSDILVVPKFTNKCRGCRRNYR